MQNLKIRVNNEAESKEAQELLFEMGFQWRGLKSPFDLFYPTSMDNYYIVLTKGSKEIQIAGAFRGGLGAWKEITLPELRDMVVLKRNDVNDATHEDKDDPEFKYRLIDNHWYVITDGNPVWRKDSIYLNEAPLFIKPIEKTMKEYLVPQNAGGFMYKKAYESKSIPDSWIAIPEGAEIAIQFKNEPDEYGIVFYKNGGKSCMGKNDNNWQNDAMWTIQGLLDENYCEDGIDLRHDILWQRATHPEELPFIDDEPKYTDDEVKYMDESGQGRLQSINDQYAEIEEVRKAIKVKSGGDSDHMADAMSYGLMGAGAASGGVDATLSQRQSQYGCYEDVAHVTQQILSALRIGNYDKLPAPMKESLHMIASKMARIVNGDPEYLDNWHDIGGYAKLIEKLIKGE